MGDGAQGGWPGGCVPADVSGSGYATAPAETRDVMPLAIAVDQLEAMVDEIYGRLLSRAVEKRDGAATVPSMSTKVEQLSKRLVAVMGKINACGAEVAKLGKGLG
jgi:hypothetical protein